MEKERSFNMFEDVSDVDGRNGTLGHFGDVVTGGKLFLAIQRRDSVAETLKSGYCKSFPWKIPSSPQSEGFIL